MTAGIGTVHVKRSRGTLVLQGMGQTPRGQNFIRQTIDLESKTTEDPDFKKHLETAVAEMFAQAVLPI